MRFQPGQIFESRRGAARSYPVRGRAQLAIATLLAMGGLSGCQSMTMNSAQLRVVDASTDTGAIDSYQDNAALAYNLGHGTVTTYVSSAAGSSTFTLDRAGTRQALSATKGTLSPGKQYTEIVTGTLVSMQTMVLEDQETPASAGHSAIRLIDVAADAAPVDIYLVSQRGSATALRLASNLAPGQNPGYKEVPEGSYSLIAVPAGADPASADRLLSGPRVDYASGAVRTIVLIDSQTPAAETSTTARSMQAIELSDADALE